MDFSFVQPKKKEKRRQLFYHPCHCNKSIIKFSTIGCKPIFKPMIMNIETKEDDIISHYRFQDWHTVYPWAYQLPREELLWALVEHQGWLMHTGLFLFKYIFLSFYIVRSIYLPIYFSNYIFQFLTSDFTQKNVDFMTIFSS